MASRVERPIRMDSRSNGEKPGRLGTPSICGVITMMSMQVSQALCAAQHVPESLGAGEQIYSHIPCFSDGRGRLHAVQKPARFLRLVSAGPSTGPHVWLGCHRINILRRT